MSKKIDISINRAEILSFEVQLGEELNVSATIGLYAGSKKVSSFTMGTKSWDDNVIDLPVSVVEPIKDISKKLETILVRECSSAMGELTAGN